MRKLMLIIMVVMIASVVYGADRTVLIPDGITDEQAKEWMAILQERKINADMNKVPAIMSATEQAKKDIDAYRKSIGLVPKFEKIEESELKEI